jgi:glutamate--cysteine ligase
VTQDIIHQRIVDSCDSVVRWFREKSTGLSFPVYSSFDVRDSGEKIAPVDANIYPAGFNNICAQDQESAVHVAFKFLKKHYDSSVRTLVLLAEEHTANAYYWENIKTIRKILAAGGFEVIVAWPKELAEPFVATAISGEKINVFGADNRNGEVWANGKKADLVICNNDFSNSYEEWQNGLITPMNPPSELGWYRRRKDQFFDEYNSLAAEFSRLIDIDPRLISVRTDRFDDFAVENESSREALAAKVDRFIADMAKDYDEMKVQQKPFVFVKNNAGTYGLAVTQVHSGDEIRAWNYKSRKKMKAAKGGRDVESLIIQEGIATKFTSATETAEPCIYTVGSELVGGFLRTHSQKGPEESLNSPGAVYKKLCMSDLEVNISGCPMENVYGTLAKIGVLAIAREAVAGKVEFRGYRP